MTLGLLNVVKIVLIKVIIHFYTSRSLFDIINKLLILDKAKKKSKVVKKVEVEVKKK